MEIQYSIQNLLLYSRRQVGLLGELYIVQNLVVIAAVVLII